ncbi:haloacid dehalogenase type II [Pseudonocardia nigra]|uniref:haloacid dehalogenase type II n=1 Tax=Pseudonocardia nigra TaxID=1921578 RepID=UPI001C602183|nr:haloacid dehalogenase type II [Pseudonocardia nigra]
MSETTTARPAPSLIVFDVNETLSDMSPMADRFAAVGAPPELAQVWFAGLLRDGFALTAAGGVERFAVFADGALRSVLSGRPLDRDLDAAVEHVLAGLPELTVHPDVPDGVRGLRATGRRLVTLTNGPTSTAERLLGSAGIDGEFERLLSVEDAGVWKPAAGAYRYAAETCGAAVSDMLLVAVHPWDIDGAARAGLGTAWVNRTGAPYPPYFRPPQHTVTRLDELPAALDRG